MTDTHPDSRVGDIRDPQTGQPRLMSSKCTTCVFRRGNLMHLAEGRLDDMVTEALDNDSWIICHDSLGHSRASVCRGFVDVHGPHSFGVRLVYALGGFTPVDPCEYSNDAPRPDRDALSAQTDDSEQTA